MTAATIWGVALADRDIAAYHDQRGTVTAANTFDQISSRLPAAGAPIDLEHGRKIGSLIYGEIDRDGRLNIVGIVHDADWLVDLDDSLKRRIHFSPELCLRGRDVNRSYAVADDADLTGVALTSRPATLGAQPIHIRAGDVRSSADTSSWSAMWRVDYPLLARAVAAVGTSRKPATWLVDQRHTDSVDRHGPIEFGPVTRVISVR